jgi:phosphate acetyltransferase
MSRVNHSWNEIAVGDVGELSRVCTADDILVFVHAFGNQRGELVADGVAEVTAPERKLMTEDVALPPLKVMRHDKHNRLLAQARSAGPLDTAVVFATDVLSLRGAVEAAEAGMINPILIGPEDKIRAVADEHEVKLGDARFVAADQAQEAAARAVKLVHEGAARAVMKGNLHSDEF